MSATKKTKSKAPPWYAEGLRFTCVPDCGKCCTSHGDYGYVYLEDGEDDRIAELLGLDRATFRKTYTARDDGHLIVKMDDPACPFLDGARCTVYEARPTQCRTFPFWGENLRTRRQWEKLKEFCPGIDEGDLHPLPVIRSRVSYRQES